MTRYAEATAPEASDAPTSFPARRRLLALLGHIRLTGELLSGLDIDHAETIDSISRASCGMEEKFRQNMVAAAKIVADSTRKLRRDHHADDLDRLADQIRVDAQKVIDELYLTATRVRNEDEGGFDAS